MSHTYDAIVDWQRGDQNFADNRYSRAHRWQFDGGADILASAAPTSVRPPFSDPAGIDPEEALVAATASCHMLFFLHFAGRAGLIVDHYRDNAVGVMTKNATGHLYLSTITLRPAITFHGDSPDQTQIDALHHQAHDACYIAHSIRGDVVIEAPEQRPGSH